MFIMLSIFLESVTVMTGVNFTVCLFLFSAEKTEVAIKQSSEKHKTSNIIQSTVVKNEHAIDIILHNSHG